MRATPEAEASDVAAVRRAIESANAHHTEALDRGDVAAFAQVYTAEARILPPDMEPLDGRAAIQQFWTAAVQQLGLRAPRLMTDEVDVFGELAYEHGRFEFATNQGPVRGKYLVVWRREPAGEWRWHRDIWNYSPAEPG